MFLGRFDTPNQFTGLNHSLCPHCFQFYRTRGLSNHINHCPKKSAVPSSPPSAASPSAAAAASPLPSLEEVFSSFCPTLIFVPAPHRQSWGRVLAAALNDVSFTNSVDAWTRLFMLPKCVLATNKRGGVRNRGDNQTVSDLCVAWENGDLKWLWERSARRSPKSSQSSDSKRVFEAAIQHSRQGRLGKACATLSSSGLAPNDASTLDKLRVKHPQHQSPDPVAPTNVVPIELKADFNLFGVLSSFAKDVGTDGTNFRIQHLLDANEANLPAPLLPLLKKVINILLKGLAPIGIQDYVAGARLVALVKGDADIRPIAVGNIFRRLASKCACVLLHARVRSVLGSLQVGVACRGGAEQIVHSMRDSLHQHWESDDFTVLKVDFSNAFNSISRQHLLNECARSFPDLLPWVQWCYGSQPLLFYGDSVSLKSCVGVQQGDPLGPLLFCLVLDVVVRKIHSGCPTLLFHKWYLDDGALAGPTASVAKALTLIRREGAPLGLNLNLAKCELFSRKADNFNFKQQDLDLNVRLCFPGNLSQRSTSPHFLLLGSPVGDADFCANHVLKLRNANKKLLDSLCKLEDPQVALHLLRTCASFCKFVYVARTTPPQLVHKPLQLCDNDIRSSLSQFAALQLTDAAWSQAQLSLSMGGLGLRSTARHCTAAYITSHTSSMPGILTVGLRSALELYALHLELAGPVDDLLVQDWLAKAPAQRSLSIKFEKKDQSALLSHCSVVDSIRLLSVSSPRSAAWLQAIPSAGPIDQRLKPDEMQAALQHRLGLALTVPDEKCNQCAQKPVLDLLGHHQLTCSTGGFVTRRHNRLRDCLEILCRSAGMSAKREQGASFGDMSRPADVLVDNWSLGKPAAFDFVVCSPLVQDNILGAGAIDVVDRAATQKHTNNDAKCDALGWICVPLAVDSYGRWGSEAHTSFSKIASHLSVRSKTSLSAASNTIYSLLGINLARFNACSILARRSVFDIDLGAREVRQFALSSDQQ